jgi:uncharacterized protein (TIGR02001 family)
MKLKMTLALSALALSAASFAQTKAPEPDYTISYNVGATSDYRYRGIAQTAGKPALQGGVDFSHKSGFYLGAWASNVKWVKDFNLATKGSYELDLYGGYRGSIVEDLGFDVGAIHYRYPGNNSGAAGTPGAGLFSNANTTELYGALTYKIATLKYSRSSGDFLGNLNSSGSSYLDLSANFDLGNGFTLTPHIGHQKVANLPAANYTDYALTLVKDFGNGLALSVAVTGTDATSGGFYTDVNGKFLGKSALVVGVKYSF